MKTLPEEKKALATRIAGEIILSDDPSIVMKKWREKFSISQTQLATELGLSSSVISDYESGRRNNPGVQFVRRFIQALFEIDEKNGKNLTRIILGSPSLWEHGILEIGEFPVPVSIKRLNRAVSGRILTCHGSSRKVGGYTVIDNDIAVTNLSAWGFLKAFGKTVERALVFTNIKSDRAPMLTLRFSLLKPTVLVYHLFAPEERDVKLAESDGVTLIYSKAKNIEALLRSLRRLHTGVMDKK